MQYGTSIYIYDKVAKSVCYAIYNSRTAVPILLKFSFLDPSQVSITQ